MTTIQLRQLQMRDLSSVEGIEQRSYPTPWSRSMFASELAKPSSICLGAFDAETDALVGYLVISRYVDAWHVMNVAVAPGTGNCFGVNFDHTRRWLMNVSGAALLSNMLPAAPALAQSPPAAKPGTNEGSEGSPKEAPLSPVTVGFL